MTAVDEHDDEPTLRIAEWERDSITVREGYISMRCLVASTAPRAALVSIPASPGRFRAVLHSCDVPPRVKTMTIFARTGHDARRVVERGLGGSGFQVVEVFQVVVRR